LAKAIKNCSSACFLNIILNILIVIIERREELLADDAAISSIKNLVGMFSFVEFYSYKYSKSYFERINIFHPPTFPFINQPSLYNRYKRQEQRLIKL
jgi:hypothetical protein